MNRAGVSRTRAREKFYPPRFYLTSRLPLYYNQCAIIIKERSSGYEKNVSAQEKAAQQSARLPQENGKQRRQERVGKAP